LSIKRGDQFLQRMTGLLGETEARRLSESLARPALKSLRYNRRFYAAGSSARLTGAVVPWCEPFGRYWEGRGLPSRTFEYAAGRYYIQEASAMLAIAAASLVLDLSGKTLLDLTAAPGGKTTQAAELLGSGYIVANEVVRKRVDALLWNVNRHRLDNVIITSLPTEQLARGLAGFFDVVVVDAPCSGEGLFQRGKHSISKWSGKNVRYCARRQQSILADALRLIKPGGYLVYSTCTFSKEENEDQVAMLLGRGMEPVPLPGAADLPVSPAVTEDEAVKSCSRRIFPHREQGAGAFVSVLRHPAGHVFPRAPAPEFHAALDTSPVSPALSCLDMDVIDGGAFFYEKNGVVSLFNQPRISSLLRENAFQTGAPLYDKRRDNALMFGSVQRPAPDRVISLEPDQAEAYIRGGDLKLDHPGGWYFAAVEGMVLGPLWIKDGNASNRFPLALRRRD
jgi:16S rRNA C967 or C1407 C5-methylase (RsmB/RsmF family)